MRLIGKRPLCTIFLSLIMSGMMGVWMPAGFVWWLLGGAVIGIGVILTAVRWRKMAFYTGCMAVCLLLTLPLGFGSVSRYYGRTVPQTEALAGSTCVVEGTIIERKWSYSYASGYLLQTETINRAPTRVKLLLTCAFPADCRPGDRIRITGTCAALEQEVRGFSERSYYLSQGVVARLETDDAEQLEILQEDLFSLQIGAARLNTALAARLRLFAGDSAGRLFSALLLGRRGDLDEGVIQAFQRLGLSHLLALSGLHLTLLTGAVGRILRLLRLPRGWRTGFQLAFVAGYVLLTGAPISVLRAALMLTFTCLSAALFAEADGMTALFGAAALICMANPASLLDLGLWMSVFATLGMLLCGELTFAWAPRSLRGAVRVATATFAANLMTLPFVALSEGELSLVALAANLVFVPLMSLLLYCAPLFLLGDGVLGTPITALAKGILSVIRRLARVKGITVALQDAGIFWCLLPMLLVCAVLLWHPPKRRAIGALALGCSAVVFLGGAVWINTPRTTEVVYTHIGQSEVMLIRQPGGTVICDMGDGSFTPLRAAASYAAGLGASEIDSLMLTHYHTKHISAVQRFTDTVALDKLLLPAPNTAREQEIAADLEEIAGAAGVAVSFYADGMSVKFGELSITPHTRTLISRSEQPLLLLRVAQGGEVLTYIGASVGETALAELAEQYAAESDYLIFGDHGPIPRQCTVLTELQETKQIVLASPQTLSYLLPADPSVPVVTAERIRLKLY